MKPGALVLYSIVLLGACALPASAFVYNGDLHTTVTVTDYEFWSGIPVSEGEILDYRVSVQSGMEVNVYLIHDQDLTLAISGGVVEQVKADEDTRSASQSCPTAGRYALVITNSPYTSVCKVDITVRSVGLWGSGLLCIAGAVAAIVVVAVVAFLVVRSLRRTPVQPAQYGAPAESYTPPPAPAPYPPVQDRVPVPGYQEPATAAPVPPRPQSPAAYQPPPPPAYWQAGQYPARPPQAPEGPPAPPPAAASTVACRYCMMEVPAGITVCPRCGGFM